VPDGIRLAYLPPYTPEHLWPLLDEPVADLHFEVLYDLDAIARRAMLDACPGPHPHCRKHHF
jgi:hypothetical protein